MGRLDSTTINATITMTPKPSNNSSKASSSQVQSDYGLRSRRASQKRTVVDVYEDPFPDMTLEPLPTSLPPEVLETLPEGKLL